MKKLCAVVVMLMVGTIGCGSSTDKGKEGGGDAATNDGGADGVGGTADGAPGIADRPVSDAATSDSAATDSAVNDAAGDTAARDSSATDTVPVTALDPAPERMTPGFFTVPGGPTTTINNFELSLSNQTSNIFAGTITNAVGNGTFYVVKTADVGGGTPTGTLEVAGSIQTATNGVFSVTAPLFCGTQIVKCVWSNAAGRAVLVTRVITTNCVEADIRVTISWDDKGLDWEAHLIKPGGRINDNATDCTWTSCLGAGPDWGVVGDATDNPHKDVDNTGTFGPENIFLAKPETGRFTVLIEHWGAGLPSAGRAIVNVRGKATVVDLTNFIKQHVRTVATIDWPAGTVTAIDSDYDCSANWSSGCRDKLPM